MAGRQTTFDEKGNPVEDRPVIQVVVPPGLRTWLEKTFNDAGLFLFPIPQEEEGALPTYGIGVHAR